MTNMTRQIANSYMSDLFELSTRPYREWKELFLVISNIPYELRHKLHSMLWHERERWPSTYGWYDVELKDRNYWHLMNALLEATKKRIDENQCKVYWEYLHDDYLRSF